MYFRDYKDHSDAKINHTLFWEYNMDKFDYLAMRNIVVQRVVERGWPQDWYGMLNLYGVEGVTNAIKEISYFNPKDLKFLSREFSLPLTAFKCFTKKQSAPEHWNY